MSSSATTLRRFYPDTNALNAAALYDASGAALVPATLRTAPSRSRHQVLLLRPQTLREQASTP